MTSLAQQLGLPNPYPAGAFVRNQVGPVYEVRVDRADGGMCLFLFAQAYSARWFIDCVIGKKKFSWKDTRTIVAEDESFKMRSPHLEELLEYEPKGKEKQWEPPEPMLTEYKRMAGIVKGPHRTASNPVELQSKEPRVPRVPTEPRPDGLVSIADIATELNIEPRDARKLLRAKNIEKPAHGAWAWPKNAVDGIKKLLRGK
jgi:hypothetical protein